MPFTLFCMRMVFQQIMFSKTLHFLSICYETQLFCSIHRI